MHAPAQECKYFLDKSHEARAEAPADARTEKMTARRK